uniref:Uncharacterized protein n=1 Tax=Aegilops tauschii subsp. strangulata TaxID=200361 RepID=A0A453EK96_AEGTS
MCQLLHFCFDSASISVTKEDMLNWNWVPTRPILGTINYPSCYLYAASIYLQLRMPLRTS